MLVLSDTRFYRHDPGLALVLAIGNFDGLHLGHQRLLEKVVSSAKAQRGRAAVLTFREHPQHILHPSAKPPLLTSVDHKLYLLERSGIDICFFLSFTPEFARIEPENFVRNILHEQLRVKEVYLGYNARFGSQRRGDSTLMRRLAGEIGFHYEELPPVRCGEDLVSSSKIRDLVREGRLKEAAGYLGRDFGIFAKVVRGTGRGARLGFPTANLEAASEILPPLGVYPVCARRIVLKREGLPEGKGEIFIAGQGESWIPGVLNYGYRPTFEGDAARAVAEAHLLDFSGDLYGQLLEIVFFPRLRAEARFENAETLKEQIRSDIQKTRDYFSSQARIPN